MQEEIVEMSCDRVRLRIWNRKSRETCQNAHQPPQPQEGQET